MGILGHPKFSITPTYISSELPGEMVQNLMNGKVVILIDQFSFAFAFSAIITDLWSTTLDAFIALSDFRSLYSSPRNGSERR